MKPVTLFDKAREICDSIHASDAHYEMLVLSQTIERICGLLAKLPGVTVLGSNLNGDEARFEVLAAGREAIDVLIHLSLGANVTLAPAIRLSELVEFTHSQKKMLLVANSAKRDEIELGELQLLAIHLVWHLHKAGLIATSDANFLLRKWRAAAVRA